MPEVHYISNSFQGLTHTENQDGYLILDEENYYLFAVFDGVSMALNPRKGVDRAINFLKQEHYRFISDNAMRLKEMMHAVNQNILQAEYSESLTTYALACFYKEEPTTLYYSNLGDSRIYYIENYKVIQLTVDDTLWPGSNILTKCLGNKKLIPSDFREESFNLKHGVLFLATDGCYGIWERNRKEFLQVLNKFDLEEFQKSFEKNVKGENPDDATYIFVQIQ